jgi:hypothetical protein
MNTTTTIPLGFPIWERLALMRELRLGEKRWRDRILPAGTQEHVSLERSHVMMATLYRDLRVQLIQEYRNFHGK